MRDREAFITKENYERFKQRYEKAVKAGRTQYNFEGTTVLTNYAKYVIQYVEDTI